MNAKCKKINIFTFFIFILVVIPFISYLISNSINGGPRTVPPLPKPQTPATVAIVRDTNQNVNQMVRDAINGALGTGGLSNIVSPGDTVLLKINLTQGYPSGSGVVTDYRVVQAIVSILKEIPAGRILIAEGSAANNTASCMNTAGYTQANFPECELIDLNNVSTAYTYDVTMLDSTLGEMKEIPAEYFDADVVIEVPLFKTHDEAGFTNSLKNVFGVAPHSFVNSGGTYKSELHNDLRKNIVDYNLARKVDFVVVDGLTVMEGNGPVNGTPVRMDLILAGKDPVAVDAVCAAIMDIPPFRIPHIVFAANENIGIMDLNQINIVGQTIDSVKRSFVRAVDRWDNGEYQYRAATVIRPTDTSITIDGNLSEWSRANRIEANQTFQIWEGQSNWTGPADCSFTGMFLYDSNNLYIAVIVTDSVKLNNTNTGSAIENGDSVEFYFSTYQNQFDRNREDTTFNSSYDYRMIFSYNSTVNNWVITHNRALTGFEVSKVDTSSGYIMEMKIPLSNFSNMTTTAYRYVGLNMVVNDADTSPSTRDTKLVWEIAVEDESTYEDGTTTIDWLTDPSEMGVAYLDKQNNAPVANAGPDKSATVNQPVSFDGSSSYDSDGDIVSYSWDFDSSNGIGQDAVGPVVQYTYTTAKTYTVTLTVTDNKGATATDTLDVVVTASGQESITVIYPNGGEIWQIATQRTVRWSYLGSVGNVNIDLSTDGGIGWINLVSNTNNDGIQIVTVPNTPSTTCRIKVSETDGTPQDVSDGNFTITAIQGPRLSLSTTLIDAGEIEINQTKIVNFEITNSGTGILTGTVSSNVEWIEISPSNFTAPSTINLTIDNTILQAKEGIQTGTVAVNSNGGDGEVIIQFNATCILVKPNPYNPDKGLLKFYGSGIVPQETKITVFTVSGEKIIRLSSKENEIYWDGKDENGMQVNPGIYIYVYESQKEKGAGKITVLK